MKAASLLPLLGLLGLAFTTARAETRSLLGPYVVDSSGSPHAKLRPLPFDAVTWTSGFWAERWKQLDAVTLPEMWRLLADDRDGGRVLQNFRIASGRATGRYFGTNWQDEWLYKWIEAAACVWRLTKEPWIKERMDEGIALISAAQQSDGYLSTKIVINQSPRFANPNDHEFYNMGHLVSAAVMHRRMTGEDSLFTVGKRCADYLCETVGVRVDPFIAHNPTIVMGLAEMFRETGERKYLATAQLVIDRRGSKPRFPYKPARPNAPEVPGSDLIQDRVPIRKATEMVGQNVFSTYLYAGACDVEAEVGDPALAAGLRRVWDDLTGRKMFVHGGISALARGLSHNDRVYESVGPAYELPNATAYNETCGQIGAFMWGARMLAISPEAGFADVMEKEMFNGFLGGVGLDGKSWFYRNPLRRYDVDYAPAGSESGPLTDMVTRTQPGERNVCCPSNLLRTFAELSSYFYSRDDTGLWIHQYGGNRLSCAFGGKGLLVLEQKTDYPWEGTVRFAIEQAPPEPVDLHLRIPSWATSASIALNGRSLTPDAVPGTYARVSARLQAGDTLTLTMPMPARLVEGNPRIESVRNQVAVFRGPLVYCVESTDLPAGTDIAAVHLPAAATFTLQRGLPGSQLPLAAEAMTLMTSGRKRNTGSWDGLYRPVDTGGDFETLPLRFIPYYAWANRGKAAMSVWLPVLWGEGS